MKPRKPRRTAHRKYLDGMATCQRIQAQLDHRISVHPVGLTLQGPPTIEVEVPVEVLEAITSDNADQVERLLRDFYDGMTGLLSPEDAKSEDAA